MGQSHSGNTWSEEAWAQPERAGHLSLGTQFQEVASRVSQRGLMDQKLSSRSVLLFRKSFKS